MASKSIFHMLTKLMKDPHISRGIDLDIKTTRDVKPPDPHTKAILQKQFEKISTNILEQSLYIDIDRQHAYQDFEAMEYKPEIAATLDIYADECLTSDFSDQILTIDTNDLEVKNILEDLFYNRLQIAESAWLIIREMCKYGDNYMALDVDDTYGIINWLPLPTPAIKRLEAYDGNTQSTKYRWEDEDLDFDSWQICHFRLLNNVKRFPYGTSMLESARKIWKQLTMSEDAMLIYRITRAPERRVFYIDVGNIEPEAVPDFMAQVKNTMKRSLHPSSSVTTGNFDLKVNPMAIDEDYFIPRRGDQNNEVDTLPGADNLDEIADIEYLQQNLFAALKVPRAYLNYSDEVAFLGDGTLAQKDVRFSRTITRVQKSFLSVLKRAAIIHLFVLGKKDKIFDFELSLNNPSTQYELQKLELLSEKASLISDLWDPDGMSISSLTWCLREIMGWSDSEIELNLKQQFSEGKIKLQIENVSEDEDKSDVDFTNKLGDKDNDSDETEELRNPEEDMQTAIKRTNYEILYDEMSLGLLEEEMNKTRKILS
jgi:hypothetical protein